MKQYLLLFAMFLMIPYMALSQDLTEDQPDEALEGGVDLVLGTSADKDVLALLYDAQNVNIASTTYIKSGTSQVASFRNLAEGQYVIYSLYANPFVYGGNAISLLSTADYAVTPVVISKGIVQKVEVTTVPVSSLESKFAYLTELTHMEVAKKDAFLGETNTVTTTISLNSDYFKKILKYTGDPNVFMQKYVTSATIAMTLPEGVAYIPGSALYGGKRIDGIQVGNILTFRPSNFSPNLTFCVKSSTVGEKIISGVVKADMTYPVNQYVSTSMSLAVPVGVASYESKGYSITGPSQTEYATIHVNGYAPAGTQVKIYDNGHYVYTTYANGANTFEANVPLYNATDGTSHKIHALVNDTYTTNSFVCYYDAATPELNYVTMSHYNEWRGRTISVRWNFPYGQANRSYYDFFLTANFTFNVNIRPTKRKIKNVYMYVYSNCGTGYYVELNKNYYNSNTWYGSKYFSWSNCPTRARIYVETEYNGVSRTYAYSTTKVNPIHDPQGYVYEAVKSNRLSGVKAVLYEKGNDEPWNAAEYDQINPQTTEADGKYKWDVPEGEWQVRFTKEGYEPAQTEWLPVPPPQLDINIPMVQRTPAVVNAVEAHTEAIDVQFSKYMIPASVTSENVYLTDGNGNRIPATVTALNEEEGYEASYANKYRITPSTPLNDEVMLYVDKNVLTYAGIAMEEDFSQSYIPTISIESLIVEDTLNLKAGEYKKLKIEVGEIAKEQILNADITSDVAKVSTHSCMIGEDGCAYFLLKAMAPGSTMMTLSLKDNMASKQVVVKVEPMAGNPVGDTNENGAVNISDLSVLINELSKDTSANIFDLNQDGKVDQEDIEILNDILLEKE